MAQTSGTSTPPDVSPLLPADRWFASITREPSKPPSMRVFGLVMLIGFGLLATLLLWSWRGSGGAVRFAVGTALATVAVVMFGWSLVAPASMGPAYERWMRFGQTLGAIVSAVLLTVLYYVVVTPVGALMRLSGTDPLDRRLRRSAPAATASYWMRHAAPARPEDYRHMA